MFNTLEKFGIICISLVGFQITRWVYKVFYSQVFGPHFRKCQIDLKAQGKWALITGCTDGIGKAYAEYLASLGINVILISRSMEKLKGVAEDIEKAHKVQTKVIEADFSCVDVYKTIEKNLYGYEIGILVNNVGLSYPHPEYFLELPCREKIYTCIINCNIMSVTKMCMMVMPGMVERGRGLVINVSSTAARIPSPMLTVYGASKAYIQKFSSDLAAEYSKNGIIIQCLLPGYVATKMSKIRRSTWMAPTPETYVKSAVKYIGVQEPSTGYYPHAMMLGIVCFIEGWSVDYARWIIMRIMENIRQRAMKRYVG